MYKIANDLLRNQLFLGGISILTIDIFLLWIWPLQYYGEYRELIASLLGSAAIALILIAAVETRHLSTALDKTANEIVEKGAKELDKKFDKSFDVLDQGKKNGLVAIYEPRQSKGSPYSISESIITEIRKTNSLLIIGVSLLDFFSYPRGAATQAGVYYGPCRERLEGKSGPSDNRLKIKVLLLDPNSEAAKFRCEVEVIDGEPASIEKDNKTALNGIKKLDHAAGRDAVKYALYNTSPQFWLVLTDEYIFLEPYHCAPTEKFCSQLAANELPAALLEVNCTGGRVPVLQFSKRSNMYIAMKAHFECLWNRFSDDK